MKSFLYSLSIVLLLVMFGCKKNPVNSQSASVTSMAKKINNGRPYDSISIVNGSYTTTYNKSDFQKVYAKDGDFVLVINNASKSYYNLEISKGVNISLNYSGTHDILKTLILYF